MIKYNTWLKNRIHVNEWVAFKDPGEEETRYIMRQTGKGPFRVVDIEACGNGLDYLVIEDESGQSPVYPVLKRHFKKVYESGASRMRTDSRSVQLSL